MTSLLLRRINAALFPSRSTGGLWSESPGWLHGLSDLAMVAAGCSIPLVLTFFRLRRKDLPSPRVSWLVAALILSCSIGHAFGAVDVGGIWDRVSGLVEFAAAVLPWTTVAALIPLLPKLLTPPGLAKDHAQRPRGIEERRIAEQRFRHAVEAVPNGIVMIDAHGRIVLVNAQAERLFGYSRDELLGEPVELLIPERFRDGHPEHRREFLADPHVRSVGAGRELFGRRRDGAEFPIEIGLTPLPTEDGLMILSVIVDLSQRKRAAPSSHANEPQLEAMIDNLAEGAVLADRNGQLLRWNRAALALHGLDAGANWKRHFLNFAELFELCSPDGTTIAPDEWPLARLIRGDPFRTFEARIRRREGNWERLFSYGGGLVRDANGQELAFLTITDITAHLRTEAALRDAHRQLEQRVVARTGELQAANKELESFAYSVSHDLRAPLRAIDGFSRILLSDYAANLPAEAQQYLNDVRGSTQQLAQLVDDLLAFSRLSRDPVRKQPVDSNELVQDCLQQLLRAQEGRAVEIRVDQLPVCQADPRHLRQVWTNLLSNALKFSRQRDPAVIEIGHVPADDPGRRTFFIRDNGVGFDMRYADRLFGVFQRLHRADEYEGTGVGLAMVQRIVHRHGGRVWADAKPNEGACIYFTLETDGDDA